jgi:hypothetical protein
MLKIVLFVVLALIVLRLVVGVVRGRVGRAPRGSDRDGQPPRP